MSLSNILVPNPYNTYLGGIEVETVQGATGTILNTDLYNVVYGQCAKIASTSTQTITYNVFSAVQFTSAVFDNSGFFNSENPTYVTIPSNGIYNVDASVYYNSLVNQAIVSIAVYQNGTIVDGLSYSGQSTNPAGPSAQISKLINCNAGDQISIYTTHYNSSTQSQNLAGNTYLNIFKIAKTVPE